MNPKLDPATLALTREWVRRISRATWGHHQAASRIGHYHYWIGIPLVIATALVSSLDSGANVPSWFRGLSGIAAILAALQTFLNLSTRSEAHKKAAASYSALRRAIEAITTASPTLPDDLGRRIEAIRTAMDSLAEQTPSLPRSVWTEAEKKYKKGEYQTSLDRIEAATEAKPSEPK